jgi:hypothetical protein
VWLFDRFRRSLVSASPQAPVVGTLVLRDEVRWAQPFHWGILLAYDDHAEWEMPANLREGHVSATPSCLAVPVLLSTDVEVDKAADPDAPLPEARVEVVISSRPLRGRKDYVGMLRCPSGQLQVGDADDYRIVEVPVGDLFVEVRLEPREHADRVCIALHNGG